MVNPFDAHLLIIADLRISRRIYRNHPEVNFKPGPFYLGDGLLGWTFNINCILWTFFVFVIFSMPTVLPVTKTNMNYASVCCRSALIQGGSNNYILGYNGGRHRNCWVRTILDSSLPPCVDAEFNPRHI
jgi:hypothetical protein